MAITKKTEIAMYLTKQHLFVTPIFPRLVQRDRFEQIRKMIHFSDPEAEDESDSLRKLRFTLDYLISKFMNNYKLDQHVAIDEYISGSVVISNIHTN